jgi:hypothetical protein
MAAIPIVVTIGSLIVAGRYEEARIASGITLGASIGTRYAPGYWKILASMAGGCLGGWIAGGKCDPVQVVKAPVTAAVKTVKKAYSSPRGYLETMWDFSPLGMNVNVIGEIRDIWPYEWDL